MAAMDNFNPSEEFELVERIGKGQFGEVWKARHTKTNRMLAIKKIFSSTDITDITKEIAIMKKCVSPFIVRYYGNYQHEGLLWIVMEYFSLGSLNDIMVMTGKTLTEPQIATVCKAMLEGLHFMQLQSKIHRDIKPHNVLINKYGEAKLCDFGISSDLEAGALRKTVIGTPYYLAPEVLKDNGYDYKADIWAVGISAIEMAEKDPPYADLHPMRVLYVLANNPAPKLTHEEHWSPEFNSFVNSCLELSPEKRPSAKELLEHPFLRKSNPSKLVPLIQAATDAIEKYGGLEKAVDAMRPKPDDEEETAQDAVDKDMNLDMLAGSGALLALDSPGSTAGTSLAIGSSDDEDGGDSFFDDFASDGSEDDDEDGDLDIDDLLADLGGDGPVTPKATATPKKARKTDAPPPVHLESTKHTPRLSDASSIKRRGLSLDLTGVLEDSKRATDGSLTSPASKQTSRTPRTRKEEGNILKIQMGANGQIFGAPPPVMTARQELVASPPGSQPNVVAEIDWKGLEEDAAQEKLRDEEKRANLAIASSDSIPGAPALMPGTPAKEKSGSAIDWSKSMAEVQAELRSATAKRHLRGATASGTASDNYEDMLAELDVIDKRHSTPERRPKEPTTLVVRAFQKEFPLSGPPCGVKGEWYGRFDGPNPFRNNPQFVVTVEKPTQVLVTLTLTKSSLANAPPRRISAHVFQVRDIVHSFPEMPSYGAVLETERLAERQVGNAGLLEEASPEAKYVVVPIIHELALHEQCSFELEIRCANHLANPTISVVKSLEVKLARGVWAETTAGGSASFPSWRQNPQYHLKVHRQTDVHIFLTQHTKIPEHLGGYIVRTSAPHAQTPLSATGSGSAIPTTPSDPSSGPSPVVRISQSKLLNNDMKFRKKVEICSGRLQLAPGSYVIIPATFEPGKLMPFTISVLGQHASYFDLELIKAPFIKTFAGQWTTNSSGGCMNSPSWIQNPKYSLTVTQPTQLTFVLSLPIQHTNEKTNPTPRSVRPGAAPLAPSAASAPVMDDPFIGFYLFKGNSGNATRLARKDLVGRTKNFTDAREVIETVRLEPGAYILLPCTYNPGVEAPFYVQVIASTGLENVAFIEEVLVQMDGEWKGPSAGGNFSHPSWRLNPQYLVTSTSDCSIVASLEQANKSVSNSELPFISLAVIRPSASLTQQIGLSSPSDPSSSTLKSKLFHITPKEVVSLSQFSNVPRQVSIPTYVTPSSPLVLLPMTMSPNVETTFKIAVNHKDAKIERLEDALFAKAVQGEWSIANGTAGGCLNNRDTWLQNPKFRFATKKPGILRFVMQQQPVAAPAAANPSPTSLALPAPLSPGGFYVFRLSSGQATNFTRQDLIGKSDFAATKEVRAQFEFEVGIYCIILTKFEPRVEGKFSLHLFATHPEFAVGSMKS